MSIRYKSTKPKRIPARRKMNDYNLCLYLTGNCLTPDFRILTLPNATKTNLSLDNFLNSCIASEPFFAVISSLNISGLRFFGINNSRKHSLNNLPFGSS